MKICDKTMYLLKSKLSLRKMSNKATISSLYYQQNILEPIFEEGVQEIYMEKVTVISRFLTKV